jgi:transposase
VTGGGLVAMWQRLGVILLAWYEQIAVEARQSAALHADETGWRVNGQTWWLWCFANAQVCYYMVDRTRGSPALEKFFTEAFAGTLVSDFWAAYDSVWTEDRQFCLAHLLRELEKVDQTNSSAQWRGFAKKLRRLIRDGIRLRKRPDFTPARYARRIRLIDRRLEELARGSYRDADATRLAQRLHRHLDHIFTFLYRPEVPYGRVEVWRGGLGPAYPLPPLSSGGASLACPCSVSTPRSSNRTCRFPASGSRTDHHTFALGRSARRTGGWKRPSV